tara:strand:- start:549 stop:1148 length:600 start_codon:yes stop_codon:yes gene_type:complete
MSGSIKLKHASGNGVIISAPSSNPAADRTLTLPSDADGTVAKTSDISFTKYAIIADVKAEDTDGGTFAHGSWQQRDLNTEISDPDGIVSITADNNFTLQAGSYLVKASAPAFRVNRHMIKLTNTTDSSDVQLGTSEYSTSVDAGSTRSHLISRFTIASAKNFGIFHRCQTTKATLGKGLGADFAGYTEMYTIVEIYKEA